MEIIVVGESDEELPSEEENGLILEYQSKTGAVITIKQIDFQRLEPSTYLNDTLIDFALQFYADQHEEWDVYVFNSFFFNELAERGYDRVKRWVSRVDLFAKDYWLLPILSNEHWMLFVVMYPNQIFVERSHQPAIIAFDSIGMELADIDRILREFIEYEWVNRDQAVILDCLSNESLPLYVPQVPLQTNAYDCGVFIVEYARNFLDNPLKFTVPQDFEELFTEELIEQGRCELKNIILQLATGNKYRPGINLYLPCPSRRRNRPRKRDQDFTYF